MRKKKADCIPQMVFLAEMRIHCSDDGAHLNAQLTHANFHIVLLGRLAMKSVECDVIVVGAGLAGLSASFMLCKHGYQVAVVEGSARPGGRTISARLDSGLTVELGGEWVGRSHVFAIGLCRELNVALAVHSFLSREKVLETGTGVNRVRPSYEVNGIPQIKGHIRRSRQSLLEGPTADRPWMEFLPEVMSADEIEAARACHELIFAQPLEKISAHRAIHHVLKGGRNLHEDFRLEGGTARLVEGLLVGRGQTLHLNQKIRSICDDGTMVRARSDTTEYRARYLVCALPAKQVATIDWNPTLPRDMAEWLSGITYCNVTKTFFEFDRPFWGTDDFSLVSGSIYQHVYHTAGVAGAGPAVLAAYSIGSASGKAAALSDADAIDALRANFPPELADFDMAGVRITRQHWSESDLCSGAYSVFATGEGFDSRARFQRLNPRIYFAGEHLGEMQGLMDGAIETGWRASDLIRIADGGNQTDGRLKGAGAPVTEEHAVQ